MTKISTTIVATCFLCACLLASLAHAQDRGGGVDAQCPVSCTSGNFIPENEPCGVNTVNCGCDCAAQNFYQLRCPEGYCGSVWAQQGSHDTDWYNVHVNDSNNDGTEQVCFTVNADTPVVVQIYTGNCGGLTLVAQGEASDCNPLTLCACLPAPQFAKLKIYPGTIAGGAVNSGLPCPTSNKYTVRYNCSGTCVLGACCYQVPPVCGIMTQAQCATLPSSTWYGVGSTCTANLCTTTTVGACCYIDSQGIQQCSQTTQPNCVNVLHGTYMGNGTPCTAATCAQTGACCFQQPGLPPQCGVMTAADCQSVGGTYLGNGVPCPPVGSPCVPNGACCYKDAAGVNQCIVTTQQDCEHSYFGTWYGAGSTCATVQCQPPTGACCYQSPLVAGLICNIMTAQQCIALNGNYLGDGSVCNPDPCEVKGACCYQQPGGPWQCIEVTAAQCATFPNGVYWGNYSLCINVQCDPPPLTGACCYQIPGTTIFQCVIVTQADCLNNYFNPQWQGNNTTCNPDPCPHDPILGACCYRNPPPSTTHSCIITTQQDCENNYPGGIYQGNGTTCAQVQCDPPVNGACCWQDLPNPTVYCTITTMQACLQNFPNSSWLGANTTCNPNPCIPTGACCYLGPAGYICQIMTQAQCSQYPQSQWYANTSCSPLPCAPKGACCFKDGPNAFYVCVVVTQQECMNYPQSTWMGANTTCNPSPCPKTGACCYRNATGTVCAITTLQECLALPYGQYLGDNVPCTVDSCKPCVTPPANMVAWWTLDETTPGGGISKDSIAANHGAWKPTATSGLTPRTGMVASGLGFANNSWVQVPHSAALDFGCGYFTIDAWIKPQSLFGTIVSKSTSFPVGYDLSIMSTGQLRLEMTTTSLRCIAQSTGAIAANVWTHIAVTATGGPPNGSRTITFYINGVAAGTTNIGCVCIGNTTPVLIGRNSFGNFYRGWMDEIEMFKRVLSQAEIQSIYAAGSYGKCKHHCYVPWDWPFCLGQNQVTVTFTVCNDSSVAQQYNVAFQPQPVGPNCTIPGPTVFTPLFTNPVSIPANTCINLQVKINRPTGMNALNQVGCYQINVTNTLGGSTSSCYGSVQDRRDLCAVFRNCCIGVEAVPVGIAAPICVNITNPTGVAVSFPYQIQAFDSETRELSTALRLNGLPPGTRYIGNLTIPPGGVTPVTVDVSYAQNNPLRFDDLLFSTGDSAVAPGGFDALIATGIMSKPKPPCPADVAPPGGNGTINVADLLAIINTWGVCPPGPNDCPTDFMPFGGNGVVNVNELLAVITAWGDCPH